MDKLTITGTREQVVLDYLLRNGSITSMEAWKAYNITRLSAAIWKLRNQYFVPISRSMEKSVKTSGGQTVTKSYARYYMTDDARATVKAMLERGADHGSR